MHSTEYRESPDFIGGEVDRIRPFLPDYIGDYAYNYTPDHLLFSRNTLYGDINVDYNRINSKLTTSINRGLTTDELHMAACLLGFSDRFFTGEIADDTVSLSRHIGFFGNPHKFTLSREIKLYEHEGSNGSNRVNKVNITYVTVELEKFHRLKLFGKGSQDGWEVRVTTPSLVFPDNGYRHPDDLLKAKTNSKFALDVTSTLVGYHDTHNLVSYHRGKHENGSEYLVNRVNQRIDLLFPGWDFRNTDTEVFNKIWAQGMSFARDPRFDLSIYA